MRQMIQPPRYRSISPVRLLQIPFRFSPSVDYDYAGTEIDVFGTINAPGTYGYPNASFTVTPLDTGTALQHFNETGDVIAIQDLLLSTSHLGFFKSGALPLGNHTMTMVADGVHNGGPTFYFDFLRIAIATNGTFESIVADDAEVDWVYTANWGPGVHVGDLLNTYHGVPSGGGSAELKFYGSNVSLYGGFVGQYDPDNPIAYINVDDEPQHTITPRDISDQLVDATVALRNQLVFATSGMPDLGATPRSLTISIPFVQPTWFVDYAIYGPYSAAPATTSYPSTTSPTSPPVGAIIGGVIGGLAGVALIVAAIFLWRRKERTREQPETAVQEEHPVSAGQLQPFMLDISRDSPATPSAQNAVGYRSKGGPRFTSPSRTSGSHILRDSTVISSGDGTSQSPFGSGSGSGTGARIQEVDGGVRLATSSVYEPEILPPTYAAYDR
jgi:hypothetical protein